MKTTFLFNLYHLSKNFIFIILIENRIFRRLKKSYRSSNFEKYSNIRQSRIRRIIYIEYFKLTHLNLDFNAYYSIFIRDVN